MNVFKFFGRDKYNKKTQENKKEAENRLHKYAGMSQLEIIDALKSSSTKGLTSQQAEERAEEFGQNIIVTGKSKGAVARALESLINPFNIVLFAVAVITYITDVVLASGAKDYTTSAILLAIIIASSAISYIQQERSGNAAEQLKNMIANKADLIRDGERRELPTEDIVAGDIVILSAGDMIPADVMFLTSKDLFIAQSSLTGESAPVEKFSRDKCDDQAASELTGISYLGFLGSNVVSGSATAIVLDTGNRTYLGSMAKSLSGDRAENSFQKGINSVSKLLLRSMAVMAPVIFVTNGLTKGDWGGALLFAAAMAVGLTPEMLPMITATTLSRGVVSMAKEKTIVKNMSAIQTFGQMDTLCSDKTGTLTEDKIILEQYFDVHGNNDDIRILRHAYLNSYYQTGLKNLIDLAIINRANEHGLDEALSQYSVVDEIPFDFSRRMMSVALEDSKGKRQLITKGAAEEVLEICSYVEYDGQVVAFDDELKKEAMRVYEERNSQGMRTLAVAQKNENISGTDVFGVQDESDMVLIGFVSFLDPPKESAKTAIKALNDHGVRVMVLTGDNDGVAAKVCAKVGINTDYRLTGADIEGMNEAQLKSALERCDIISKLAPEQKSRIVAALQESGKTVGYMGDGINDAPALHQADVGISVDSAVDIAKETADIILMEKDLMVLERGVVEGRRTFGNVMKYIKMAVSGNFGNVFSVLIASIFLPFLPLLPIHILVQNLLCDFSQMGIPFDQTDEEYKRLPRKWDSRGVQRFMIALGPLSSIFDLLCFAALWIAFDMGSMDVGVAAPLFRCGWFIFGTLSQILIVHIIRTEKIPFIESSASKPLMLSSIIIGVITLILGFTKVAYAFDLTPMTIAYIPILLILLIGYSLSAQIIKKIYKKKYGEWL